MQGAESPKKGKMRRQLVWLLIEGNATAFPEDYPGRCCLAGSDLAGRESLHREVNAGTVTDEACIVKAKKREAHSTVIGPGWATAGKT